MTADEKPTRAVPLRPRRCPICGAPAAHGFRPFCSRRCANIDLGRWFKGDYAIPGEGPVEDVDGLDEEP